MFLAGKRQVEKGLAPGGCAPGGGHALGAALLSISGSQWSGHEVPLSSSVVTSQDPSSGPRAASAEMKQLLSPRDTWALRGGRGQPDTKGTGHDDTTGHTRHSANRHCHPERDTPAADKLPARHRRGETGQCWGSLPTPSDHCRLSDGGCDSERTQSDTRKARCTEMRRSRAPGTLRCGSRPPGALPAWDRLSPSQVMPSLPPPSAPGPSLPAGRPHASTAPSSEGAARDAPTPQGSWPACCQRPACGM